MKYLARLLTIPLLIIGPLSLPGQNTDTIDINGGPTLQVKFKGIDLEVHYIDQDSFTTIAINVYNSSNWDLAFIHGGDLIGSSNDLKLFFGFPDITCHLLSQVHPIPIGSHFTTSTGIKRLEGTLQVTLIFFELEHLKKIATSVGSNYFFTPPCPKEESAHSQWVSITIEGWKPNGLQARLSAIVDQTLE